MLDKFSERNNLINSQPIVADQLLGDEISHFFLKNPTEYPIACCGDESGRPEGLIQTGHGTKSEYTCGL